MDIRKTNRFNFFYWELNWKFLEISYWH